MIETPNDESFSVAFQKSQELGMRLIEILGLPDHLIQAEIVLTANQPVMIKCQYSHYLTGDSLDEVISEFAQYELVKK